jgi:hypothetical protein
MDAMTPLETALRSLIKEYPLRIFLLASTSLTHPQNFESAHGL